MPVISLPLKGTIKEIQKRKAKTNGICFKMCTSSEELKVAIVKIIIHYLFKILRKY